MASLPNPEAMWRVLVDSLALRADSELIEHDDWTQLRTPSSPYHTNNKVMRARCTADDVDPRIAAVLDDHRSRNAGLTWIVDHDSTPADLSQRLEAAGLDFDCVAIGMARAVPNEAPPPLPPGVRVRKVTLDDAPVMGQLSYACFGGVPSFADFVADWVRAGFRGELGDLSHWLVSLDGETVGWCTLRVLGSLGYLQGAGVLPSARGRGLYRAMTWLRLEALRERGIPCAVIWADESTSGPIAVRMGFQEICSARYYRLADPN
ncbi:MAG: GNAT family N-acetyltransferase [Myxococcota bacterium]